MTRKKGPKKVSVGISYVPMETSEKEIRILIYEDGELKKKIHIRLDTYLQQVLDRLIEKIMV